MKKEDWIRLYHKSFEDLNAGAIPAAEASCRVLLLQTPDDPAVNQLMAAIRLAANDCAGAGRFAEASLARRPNHAPTLVLAGTAARRSGDLGKAASLFRRAAKIEPNRPETAFQACLVQIERRGADISAMIADLKKRFPDHASAWVEIGRALEGAGEAMLALAAFDLAFDAAPTSYLAYKRGEQLHGLGDLKAAETALKHATALDGGQFAVWFKLGLVLHDVSDLPGSASAYRRALELRPDFAEAETNLGIVLQDGGDLASAKQAYGRAMLLSGDSFSRAAHALTTAPNGELWLDMKALRDHLLDEGRRSLARRSR